MWVIAHDSPGRLLSGPVQDMNVSAVVNIYITAAMIITFTNLR